MSEQNPQLKRELGLWQATAINMIDMVGIGPFITLYLVIQIMGGPHFLWAWVAGALISLIDGMIWSELGSAFPKAGGSYHLLREAYGKKWGKLMSFLYVWQTLIQAPLVIASGAIGFSEYLSYIFPLTEWQMKAASGTVVILITLLLYRKIDSIGRISMVLFACVLVTFLWIIVGAISNPNKIDITQGINNFEVNNLFAAALGAASVKTIYSYLGYYNVCHLGGEIQNPEKNIPRSIFISIVGIAILYLSLNASIVSVIPWSEAMHSKYVVSLYIEKLFGQQWAVVATVLILIVAFSSLFAVVLGYSRIPYAAAVDGQFFLIFSKLHPTKNFPYVSLLILGATGLVFSLLFRLSEAISAILAVRILIQFIGQAVGVIVLRKRGLTPSPPSVPARADSPKERGDASGSSYKMPLYPLPVFLAIVVWLWIFFSTGINFALPALGIIILGTLVYFLKNRLTKKSKTANLS